MKKMFLMAIAMVFTFSAYASDVSKKIDVPSFNGLDISSFFTVTVVKGSREKVNITIDDELEPFLVAKVYGNTLHLGLDTDRMPSKLRNNTGNRTLKAEITMSSLVKLDVSGAAKFTTDDTFTEREFEGDFSGASNVKCFVIVASNADFDISGASDILMTVNADKADYDISGASNVDISGDTKVLEAEVSGAASLRLKGTFNTVDVDCSGASKCTLKGKTDVGVYGASGASKVDAEDLVARDVDVDASGASGIYANVTESISVELSGASSLHYIAPENVRVDVKEISRGCSMRRK